MRITYRLPPSVAATLVLSWSMGPVGVVLAQPPPKEQCLAQMAMLKQMCERSCAGQGGGAQIVLESDDADNAPRRREQIDLH